MDDGQIEAVRTGQVDIASNSGTWEPVQSIASGDDLAIIGGFMLTGCMPVVAREDQEWNSQKISSDLKWLIQNLVMHYFMS